MCKPDTFLYTFQQVYTGWQSCHDHLPDLFDTYPTDISKFGDLSDKKHITRPYGMVAYNL